MEFKDLLEWAKAEAIANTVQPTEVSIWREICRNYSKKFSTPLHLCLDGTIDPAEILLAEFEDQLSEFDDEKDLEVILEQIYRIEDPDYDDAREGELREFIKDTEKKEKQRLKDGKPIHKALKDDGDLKFTPNKTTVTPEKKKGGYINLSYLEKEEQGSGFDQEPL